MKKTIFLFSLLFACTYLYAAQSITGIIGKMESRRGYWTSFHGFLRMNFSTPQGKTADCRAEIYYNRLEEQIILKGFRDNQELLFIFQTDDRDFKLYLPKQKTEYLGTIFDLEDSPDIHSHLKALDLYRALKPWLIREDNTSAEESSKGLTLLKIQGSRGQQRQVWINTQGDVLKEEYGANGKLKTIVERSEFKKISPEGKEKFYYPFNITIKNATESGVKQTSLIFESVDFDAENKSKFSEFKVPEGTPAFDVSSEFKKQEALASS